MKILENHDLSRYNTFGVEAKARFFCVLNSEEDFSELIKLEKFKESERIFLGGGSNVLFVHDFPGMVILNKLKGIEIVEENSEHVLIRAKSGEDWHTLVEFTVSRGWWGMENLAFIPGSVGGAPMQNIGAYGAEVKEVIVSVECLDVTTGEKRIFENEECNFGYRDSIFKSSIKGKYFITSVLFKLAKQGEPNLTYKVLMDYLSAENIEVRSPKDISDVVTAIRRSKLPDPKAIGNAGSFFKNVYVSREKFNDLQNSYPNIPHFKEGDKIKIPSGWLVEQAGWRGRGLGKAGTYDKQALVLVNKGGSTGGEILELAQNIIKDIQAKFDVTLVPEVNIV